MAGAPEFQIFVGSVSPRHKTSVKATQTREESEGYLKVIVFAMFPVCQFACASAIFQWLRFAKRHHRGGKMEYNIISLCVCLRCLTVVVAGLSGAPVRFQGLWK